LREVRKDLQEFRREFELPKVDVTASDAGRVDVTKVTDGAKQVADSARQVADGARQGVIQAAQAAGLVKATSGARSRRPLFVAGIVTLGVVGFALLNSPAVKTRLRDSAERARERMAARRGAWDLDDETHAFDAARPATVKTPAYADALGGSDSPFTGTTAELPEGLGAESEVRPIEEDAPARA
jgi:X-X-X-Leu-X-X-Gly heptad repeat protein